MLVINCYKNALELRIITGKHKGETVFLPRLKLISDEKKTGVKFSRRQFHIKVAFAITINKSQGQTLNHVGIYLKNNVFGHGQLYVALSRCGDPRAISVFLDTQITDESKIHRITKNIVFKEVFPQ